MLRPGGSAAGATDAGDPGTNHHAGASLTLVGLRMPDRIIKRLARRAHGKDDEVVDFALLLRRHPLVRIEAAIGAIPTGNLHCDLARDVGDVEMFDLARAALACKQPFPCRLYAAAERCPHPQSGNDHTSHSRLPVRTARPVLVMPSRG